jgi:hypothetical protein
MCVKTFIIVADVIKSRGRGAIEAHKVVMKLEQSIPKVFKKIQAMKEGGGCDTSAVTTATTSVMASTSSTTTVSKPPTTGDKIFAPANIVLNTKVMSRGISVLNMRCFGYQVPASEMKGRMGDLLEKPSFKLTIDN